MSGSMLTYAVIGGSRAYGLNTESSDTDILRLSNDVLNNRVMPLDNTRTQEILIGTNEFLNSINGKYSHVQRVQLFFPARYSA